MTGFLQDFHVLLQKAPEDLADQGFWERSLAEPIWHVLGIWSRAAARSERKSTSPPCAFALRTLSSLRAALSHK